MATEGYLFKHLLSLVFGSILLTLSQGSTDCPYHDVTDCLHLHTPKERLVGSIQRIINQDADECRFKQARYLILTVTCKVQAATGRNKTFHDIVKRGTTGPICNTSAIAECTIKFQQKVIEEAMDTVAICGLMRDYINNCLKKNTQACPAKYEELIGQLRSTLKQMESVCGDMGVDSRVVTTPSWIRTCDTSKAIGCVADYQHYLKQTLADIYKNTRESLRRGFRALTDFKAVCSHLSQPEIMEACVDSVMLTCTNPAIKNQYYHSVMELLSFCNHARWCDEFDEAARNTAECAQRHVDQLLFDSNTSHSQIDINCRSQIIILECQHKHFVVCPVLQEFMTDNVLIGAGKIELLVECAPYKLPWQAGYESQLFTEAVPVSSEITTVTPTTKKQTKKQTSVLTKTTATPTRLTKKLTSLMTETTLFSPKTMYPIRKSSQKLTTGQEIQKSTITIMDILGIAGSNTRISSSTDVPVRISTRTRRTFTATYQAESTVPTTASGHSATHSPKSKHIVVFLIYLNFCIFYIKL